MRKHIRACVYMSMSMSTSMSTSASRSMFLSASLSVSMYIICRGAYISIYLVRVYSFRQQVQELLFTAVLTPLVDHPDARDRILRIERLGAFGELGTRGSGFRLGGALH